MMKKHTSATIIEILLFTIMLFVISCSLSGGGQDSSVSDQQTQMAFSVRKTMLAVQVQQALTSNAPPQTNNANPPPPPQENNANAPTPDNLNNPPPASTPNSPPPPPPPTTQAPTEDVMTKLKSAKILFYEDIYGAKLSSRVKPALDKLGITSPNLVFVGDRLGDFKTQLNGDTWDLIIMVGEARNDVKGEFWKYMRYQVEDGAALVIEMRHLDQISVGEITPLLELCGIKWERNWERKGGESVGGFGITWYRTESPFLSTPNKVDRLPLSVTWEDGDAGDLIGVVQGKDAELLMGMKPGDRNTNGMVADCLGGRVVFQTIGTHDYGYDATVALWENYIYNALSNKFK